MESGNRKSLQSSVMLLITAWIWGVAFVAQSEGMNYVGGFTFNACRFIIGGIVLIPCIFLLQKVNREQKKPLTMEEKQARKRKGIVGGVCCGVFLCLASSLQQFGIAFTTVGKAGFITALYIILVPVLGLFMKKKVGRNVWFSVGIAALGMYLLCIKEGFSVGKGDFLVFLCSIGFSLHILVIDYFSPKADGVVISCVQFFTAGIISGAGMFLFEQPSWGAITAAWMPVLYAGIMSCGVAYTLQVIAQKDIAPTIASLLMSLESVFSVLAGWLLLGQRLSGKELAGCVLVFVGIVLAQLPERKKN
ncbi:DMT family transporter [Clostridiaceae bacterium]|jgi:Permeases of the drug/metabolite transporter (DMT) superfamily|nr:DMT family transporter [Lachnospiraceae bacterium]NBH19248.1 DMT family transporter [Clostridiaceae bacterium]